MNGETKEIQMQQQSIDKIEQLPPEQNVSEPVVEGPEVIKEAEGTTDPNSVQISNPVVDDTNKNQEEVIQNKKTENAITVNDKIETQEEVQGAVEEQHPQIQQDLSKANETQYQNGNEIEEGTSKSNNQDPSTKASFTTHPTAQIGQHLKNMQEQIYNPKSDGQVISDGAKEAELLEFTKIDEALPEQIHIRSLNNKDKTTPIIASSFIEAKNGRNVMNHRADTDLKENPTSLPKSHLKNVNNLIASFTPSMNDSLQVVHHPTDPKVTDPVLHTYKSKDSHSSFSEPCNDNLTRTPNIQEEYYQVEECQADEPEVMNMRVGQQKGRTTGRRKNDDEEDDLIEKEHIDVDNPYEDKINRTKNRCSSKQTSRVDSQADDYDEEYDDEEEDKNSNMSATSQKFDEEEFDKLCNQKSNSKKIQGIPIKDLDQRKEVLSFIAYPSNLEVACKMLSQNKQIQLLQDGPVYNKNRIFISGMQLMSNKLIVCPIQSKRLCDDLQQTEVHQQQVRKINFLDKKERTGATAKMKGLLTSIVELQQKYVDLQDFKKHSCLTVNQAVPKLKFNITDNEEGLSDNKIEQIKIHKRRRRRFKNSFFYADNLIQWTQEELNTQEPKNLYQGTTLQYYEASDKKHTQHGQANLIKSEIASTPGTMLFNSPEKTRQLNQYGNTTTNSQFDMTQAGLRGSLAGNSLSPLTNCQRQMHNQFSNNSISNSQGRQVSSSQTYQQLNSGTKKNVLIKNQTSGYNQSQFHGSNGAKNQQRMVGQVGNHMDILKKFRYNFHYWLRNCYQAEDGQTNSQADIYHMAEDATKNDKTIGASAVHSGSVTSHSNTMNFNKQHSSKSRINGPMLQQWSLNKTSNAVDMQKTATTTNKDHQNDYSSEFNMMSPTTTSQIRDLTGTPEGFLPSSITNGKKLRSDKYMVLQMGQSNDDRLDQALIQYLSSNALAIQHHPGAVQFQVSKQMLATLKKKFGHMKAVVPQHRDGDGKQQAAHFESATTIKDIVNSKQAFKQQQQQQQQSQIMSQQQQQQPQQQTHLSSSTGQYIKKLNSTSFQKTQFAIQGQPQQVSNSKVFTRHHDQLIYSNHHHQLQSHHQKKAASNLTNQVMSIQNGTTNRHRFETFKGRLAAKSNPPTADTATTAASMNTTQQNYIQNNSSHHKNQPRRPTVTEHSIKDIKMIESSTTGLMTQTAGAKQNMISHGKGYNYTISQQHQPQSNHNGPQGQVVHHQVGINSMKTLFQNQHQASTVERRSGKAFRKDVSTDVVHFPYLSNDPMFPDNQNLNKSLRMVTAAPSLYTQKK